ncbi:MAG: hypothetical protein ACI9QC_000591 [Oceanicoccus sp.]|jgi:hypothetical protein
MAFFSKLKRKFSKKRRTNSVGFRSYKSERGAKKRKRPISPKSKKAPKASSKAKSPTQVRLWRWLKIVAIAAISIVLIYFFLFSRVFTIQTVQVNSDSDFIMDEKNAVTTYFQDYLGENIVLLSANEHESILLEEYSNLKSINIDRDFPHGLEIDLESYEDTANIQVNHEDGTKQFFVVNELGIISGAGLTNEYLPTVVMDVTGTDLDIQSEDSLLILGQTLLETETLRALIEVKTDFEGKFNMQILEVHYLKRARELHLYTERYFFVWIDLTQEVEIQLNKLKKAMTELNIYEAPLVYIDLRISGQNGEKVIYKLSTETENQ